MMLQPGSRPVPDYPDYKLVRKLGAGAFGEVWHAHGPGGLDVALKFIRLDAHVRSLELRSLEVMKSIRHPNLVSLFGAWHKDNWLILAIELCDRSLQDRLTDALHQKLPGIPLMELLNCMRDAANGLDALNARQVQHRDVKPANLLLLDSGVKVADFGLAKALEQTVATNTVTGTLAYTAPECFKGELTQQSDQYSLAVTYYHLRTGHLLFKGDQAQVMYAHLEVEPDLSHLPPAEGVVLARALSKEPAKRWPTCKVFVNELIDAQPHPKEKLWPTSSPRPKLDKPKELIPARLPKKPVELRQVSLGQVHIGGFLGFGKTALDVTMTVAWIAPGTFLMGSPKDEAGRTEAERQHEVTLTKGFYMGISAVTRRQFLAFVEHTGYKTQAEREGGIWLAEAAGFYLGKEQFLRQLHRYDVAPRWGEKRKLNGMNWRHELCTRTNEHPVVCVSWNDSVAFANWLAERLKLPCWLPTEAEWEYACRAGTTTPFSTGETISTDQANYDGGLIRQPIQLYPNSGRNTLCWNQITPAGKFPPNPWGLYDMHGNVFEWCQDWFGDYPQKDVVDPKGPNTGNDRVVRGGWYYGYPEFCRSAYRLGNAPGDPQQFIGFRVCICPD